MEVNFVDTGYISKLKIRDEAVNFDLTNLNSESIVKYKENNQIKSKIEQLQKNVLNSLNYASNQKLLPSTLPEQLNIKFLNISKLDKLKDKIIPSSIENEIFVFGSNPVL